MALVGWVAYLGWYLPYPTLATGVEVLIYQRVPGLLARRICLPHWPKCPCQSSQGQVPSPTTYLAYRYRFRYFTSPTLLAGQVKVRHRKPGRRLPTGPSTGPLDLHPIATNLLPAPVIHHFSVQFQRDQCPINEPGPFCWLFLLALPRNGLCGCRSRLHMI
jgi:hypothetical protein